MNVSPLFEKAGLDQQAMSDPSTSMSLEQELRFTQAAIETLDDQTLGLAVGPRYHLVAYGVLGMAVMTSPTLREGLRTAIDYNSLTWTRFRWRLCVDGEIALLEAQEREPIESCYRYMLDRDITALLKLCEEMLGRPFQLLNLQLRHSAPAYAECYGRLFNCPVELEAKRNALVFEASWLDQPLPQANPVVWAVLRAQCEELIGRLKKENSYAQMIECLMVDSKGDFLTLEQVADKLHASSRTLRRKLSQEGTSFQELLTRVRSTLAKELLVSGKLSVDQVAEQLGYSDSTSFSHAFKRWTGKPPSAYR